MDKLHDTERTSDNEELKRKLFRSVTELVFDNVSMLPLYSTSEMTTEHGAPVMRSTRMIRADQLLHPDKLQTMGLDSVGLVYVPRRRHLGRMHEEAAIVGAYPLDRGGIFTLQIENPGLDEKVAATCARRLNESYQRRPADEQDVAFLHDVMRALKSVHV